MAVWNCRFERGRQARDWNRFESKPLDRMASLRQTTGGSLDCTPWFHSQNPRSYLHRVPAQSTFSTIAPDRARVNSRVRPDEAPSALHRAPVRPRTKSGDHAFPFPPDLFRFGVRACPKNRKGTVSGETAGWRGVRREHTRSGLWPTNNEASRPFPRKPSGRRIFWIGASLARPSQTTLGMLWPHRLAPIQNPSSQCSSYYSNRLLGLSVGSDPSASVRCIRQIFDWDWWKSDGISSSNLAHEPAVSRTGFWPKVSRKREWRHIDWESPLRTRWVSLPRRRHRFLDREAYVWSTRFRIPSRATSPPKTFECHQLCH